MNVKCAPPRVLIASNTPFIPATQGDSRRLLGIITGLRRYGIVVGVINLHDDEQHHADYLAMRDTCDFLDVYHLSNTEIAQRSSQLDSWCPESFLKMFRAATETFLPDVVVAQFAYMSRCLAAIDDTPAILKVLDADNVFHLRQASFSEAGIEDDWVETTVEEEVRCWRRADLVLSIQHRERRAILKHLPGAQVVVLYPSTSLLRLNISNFRTLLFVGANNPANAKGLHRFVRETLPKVQAVLGDVKLNVVGAICGAFQISIGQSVCLHGIQTDLTSHYEQSALVLNLVDAASGINMKLVEALSHGRCVVSTPAGAHAVQRRTDAVVIAEHGAPMAEEIINLLSNPPKLKRLSESAYSFAASHFSESEAILPLTKVIFEWSKNRDRNRVKELCTAA